MTGNRLNLPDKPPIFIHLQHSGARELIHVQTHKNRGCPEVKASFKNQQRCQQMMGSTLEGHPVLLSWGTKAPFQIKGFRMLEWLQVNFKLLSL